MRMLGQVTAAAELCQLCGGSPVLISLVPSVAAPSPPWQVTTGLLDYWDAPHIAKVVVYTIFTYCARMTDLDIEEIEAGDLDDADEEAREFVRINALQFVPAVPRPSNRPAPEKLRALRVWAAARWHGLLAPVARR